MENPAMEAQDEASHSRMRIKYTVRISICFLIRPSRSVGNEWWSGERLKATKLNLELHVK